MLLFLVAFVIGGTGALLAEDYEGLGEEFNDVKDVLKKMKGPIPDPFQNIYPSWTPTPVDIRDSGPPLILSDLEPGVARSAAKVTGPLGEVEGYSGFVTVEPKYNSSLYFWYFPSKKGAENSPLILWLQGGPGASSLFGMFTEIGPYEVVGEKLQKRKISWHEDYSLLFIDSPVGTGFSFTDDEDGYRTNQKDVAKDLHTALQQFFRIFQELRSRPFFITGESYAGKHIPSLALEIHLRNQEMKNEINLKGFAIGNPFINPPENLQFSQFCYPLGLCDTPTRRTMLRMEKATEYLLKQENFVQAHGLMSMNLHLLMTNSNFTNIYNILHPHENTLSADFVEYVQSAEARTSLHVGDAEYSGILPVYRRLIPDFMKSGLEFLNPLLGQYPILLYSGHMDIIVWYGFTRQVVESLSGPCPHRSWMVDGKFAGYRHKCGHLEFALVHAAGHMVPTDRPEAAKDLIDDFISRALNQ
ncbi:unnamed protein product [Nezara viridula]|uniref:Carboxypeptidase n=1 Tax=Nezara viridula TaxID=85310 RepID=A0A9P0H6X6_NEZVI|nr:unnamed protein product [Nezara viridula]